MTFRLCVRPGVWLSYEFTLLSNLVIIEHMALMVWLSYESQTNAVMLILLDLFDYHMNLHYSQTNYSNEEDVV